MNTSSKRYRLQVLIEAAIGCPDPVQLGSYKLKFEKFSLPPEEVHIFQEALIEDATDTFYKGALTLVEALTSIENGYQSWAIVKLYYSTFYFIRSFFGTRNLGIVKCGSGIYTLKVDAGATAIKRTGVKHNGQDVRGDHKTTTFIFEKEFGNDELVLSNKIDDGTVFEWMMSAREDINYRHPTFSEPEMDFFHSSITEEGGLARWLKIYIDDEDGLHLFQEDHCCLATPLHLLKKLRRDFKSRLGIGNPLTEEQQQSLMKLITRAGLEKSSALLALLQN